MKHRQLLLYCTISCCCFVTYSSVIKKKYLFRKSSFSTRIRLLGTLTFLWARRFHRFSSFVYLNGVCRGTEECLYSHGLSVLEFSEYTTALWQIPNISPYLKPHEIWDEFNSPFVVVS